MGEYVERLLQHEGNTFQSYVDQGISSIIHYGTLPPVILSLQYSTFVLPLFDYCDVDNVCCPTTAKLTTLLTLCVVFYTL